VRPPINPAIADLLIELSMKHGPRGGETVGEAKTRLRLLMEDVSDELDADACRAAIRAGKSQWEFMPGCKAIVDAAQPFLAERRAWNREQREAREATERKALPPPVYVDAADTAQILADCFAKLNKGYQRMEGRPMPGARQQREAVPRNVSTALRMPTQADLQAIADDLDNKPRRERMTFTKADCVSLGIDPARVA
jgi:hypothetical protein